MDSELVKFAVTLAFRLGIVRVPGLAPLRSPEKPVNWYPEFGVAVTPTCVPAPYEPPDGTRLTVPEPDGLTAVVKVYSAPGGAK